MKRQVLTMRQVHEEILRRFYQRASKKIAGHEYRYDKENDTSSFIHHGQTILFMDHKNMKATITDYPSNSTHNAICAYLNSLYNTLDYFEVEDKSDKQYGFLFELTKGKSLLEMDRNWTMTDKWFLRYYNQELNTKGVEKNNHKLHPHFPKGADVEHFISVIYEDLRSKEVVGMIYAKKFIMFLHKLDILDGERIKKLTREEDKLSTQLEKAIATLSLAGELRKE